MHESIGGLKQIVKILGKNLHTAVGMFVALCLVFSLTCLLKIFRQKTSFYRRMCLRIEWLGLRRGSEERQ